ncbi:hypothetical protein HK097_009929 [Rhizophlyctis rosea]|uniref:SMAD/FHA domain-containing protein n=1 Tax=Rhizophlyctis rosea TaxID=64517 RepID=A0AAD5XAA6_9FUNG|nr:hypothetical protein HK097_009929 [Rhizophlyctis rosea]
MSAPIPFSQPGTQNPQHTAASPPSTSFANAQSHSIIRLQLFPHAEQPHRSHYHGFSFPPVEKDLRPGTLVRIGRKVDKRADKEKDGERGHRSRRDKSNNVSEGAEEMETGDVNNGGGGATTGDRKRIEFIAFRSKVVSRTHAELWAETDGQIYFRDVGSSSGTFLNRLRLSPSGKESKPHLLKSGDVLQLGVDYQGRQEEIYKCVMIKVFVTRTQKPRTNPQRLRQTLTAFLTAMNPNASEADAAVTSDCCICLSSIAPFQALFLAPCSHCFHYKCATPLLSSAVMFQCPLCRQVANLEANVTNEDFGDEVDGDVDAVAGRPPSVRPPSTPASARPPSGINIAAFLEERQQEAERVGRVTAMDPDALLSDGEADMQIGSPPLDSVMTLARGARSKGRSQQPNGVVGSGSEAASSSPVGSGTAPMAIPKRAARSSPRLEVDGGSSSLALDDGTRGGQEARTFVPSSALKAALREQNNAIDEILNELPAEIGEERKRTMRARLLQAAQEAAVGIQRQASPGPGILRKSDGADASSRGEALPSPPAGNVIIPIPEGNEVGLADVGGDEDKTMIRRKGIDGMEVDE